MAWFQRERDPAGAPSDPGDDANTLLDDLVALRRYINQQGGRLPTLATVTAHQIADVLHGVVDAADEGSLDPHTTVRLRGFLIDYVPSTVRAFLAVDATQATGGDEHTVLLQEQLDSLLDEATALLAGARSSDADALLAQGNFLRTKFSRSDLDL